MSKIALITGGSTGIGRAIVEKFLAQDFVVYTFARGERKGSDLEKVKSPNLFVHKGSVTDEKFCQQLVETISKKHGQLDVLVNNAGVYLSSGSIDEPVSAWRETFEINLFGNFALTQACYPLLRKAKGNIVNISSVCSTLPQTCGSASYSASKAAMDSLTTSLAKDLGADGIRVNSINPGIVETPMWGDEKDFMQQKAKELHALQGKVVQPQDIAEAVFFISSPAAQMITGAILPVDAGYTVS